MRYLVVAAHPLADSFNAALRQAVIEGLTRAGHEIDLLDLYAERFDPVLSAAERTAYFAPAADHTRIERAALDGQIARLRRAEGIVLVYPTWWFGFPAILKGWLDRVWLPGVAFELGGPALRPGLRQVTRLAVVTSYGSPAWYIRLVMRDPARRIVRRGLATLCHPRCRTRFLALYGMDGADERRRRRFLAKVRRRLASL